MQTKLDEYWPKIKDDALISQLIDPRFNHSTLKSSANKQAVFLWFLLLKQNIIFNYFKAVKMPDTIYSNYKAKLQQSSQSPISSQSSQVSQAWQASQTLQQYQNPRTVKNVEKPIQLFRRFLNAFTKIIELKIYFSEPLIVSESSVLDYWKTNIARFPILSIIAKDYLSMMPTSVASERSFSLAGLQITDLRASLNPNTTNQTICLSSWQKLLKNLK